MTKLQGLLFSVKGVAETKEEEIPADDPSAALKQLNTKLTKMMKGLKSHRERFRRLEETNKGLKARLHQLEEAQEESPSYSPSKDTSPTTPRTPRTPKLRKSASVKTPKSSSIKSPRESRPKLTMSMSVNNGGTRHRGRSSNYSINLDELKEEQSLTRSRMHYYQFGSRKLQVLKPTEYPTKKEAQRPVEGKLELFYAHGYSGNFDESRQNICLSQDGTKLIYYIAAIAVVFDFQKNEQKFFTKHNDDLTTYVMNGIISCNFDLPPKCIWKWNIG